ncbi:MAG: hypothetical protein HOP34_05940 [Methylococcaceae bacterium]|nr:hypothetical protein [Methylococcaceae bacterium]
MTRSVLQGLREGSLDEVKTAVSGTPRPRFAGNAAFRLRLKRLIPAY